MKEQKHAAAASSSKIEISWPHLAELARQSSVISTSVQSENNTQNGDFADGTVSQSTSFTVDPAYSQTILSQQSFNSKVLRYYQYKTSPNHNGSHCTCKSAGSWSHRPYIPPYETDLAQSSPRAVKRSPGHSDHTKSKKKRSDGTETSNSWQAERIEDSVAYKARAKKLWKQAQESPMKFQAVV